MTTIDENTTILYACAENETFNMAIRDFALGASAKTLEPKIDGKSYSHYLAAVRDGKTTKDIFDSTKTLESGW